MRTIQVPDPFSKLRLLITLVGTRGACFFRELPVRSSKLLVASHRRISLEPSDPYRIIGPRRLPDEQETGRQLRCALQHIPDKGFQLRYYGWYSNKARDVRAKR